MKELPAPAPLAVTLKEAARMLSISHWTMRRVIAKGLIRTRKLNNKTILIAVSELQRFVAESTTTNKNGNG